VRTGAIAETLAGATLTPDTIVAQSLARGVAGAEVARA
jgi:hypothetical protein